MLLGVIKWPKNCHVLFEWPLNTFDFKEARTNDMNKFCRNLAVREFDELYSYFKKVYNGGFSFS